MQLMDLLMNRLAGYIPLLLSLTVHEWAHAWTAWRLGDDTAKMLGRVSLNPLDHIDPVGTVILPLLGVPFGWAKPVPVNPVRFRGSLSMPFGVLLVAAAGPISNLLIAAVSLLCLTGLVWIAGDGTLGLSPPVFKAAFQILQSLFMLNVLLACFNLLPIPPLDGSRIVEAIIPRRFHGLWGQVTAIGPGLLFGVILLLNYSGVNLLAGPMLAVQVVLNWVAGA